ncbi:MULTISPECIES: dTMP kinase [unclassified Sphingomonas]|uniref:dTMP kinase n=1 Tax=unclassified Sphingomonas TaxID=196159 RepID=UPI0006F4AF22|nr:MULTISPECIES: dTMP kinase [unclassified Sphingomonas]KQX19963.1 thymidylate kinase [Sphingomonas sp. Root1294]KQY67210.1 thymidylate kinase [Sphingomonas sp. Root50]KRB90583.1 thymidylate kinase [Sphingomonas sp. Root720]
MPGRFITLEGGEGVGKSTQSRALAAALRARGIDVVETREPGGSDGAEAIRRLLLEGSADRWNARAEALLFAAARADHVARTIRPAIDAGRWVVCDRFLDSSIAYQGGADGLGDEAIRTLHAIGSAGYLPDRTLFLDMPVFDASFRQVAAGIANSDRFEKRDDAFHERVAASFRRIARDEPGRVHTINAQGSPQEVTARLIEALADLLA